MSSARDCARASGCFFGLDGLPAELFVTGEYSGGKRVRSLKSKRIAELAPGATSTGALRPLTRTSPPSSLSNVLGDEEQVRAWFESALNADCERLARALLTLDPAQAPDLQALNVVFPQLSRKAWFHVFEPFVAIRADDAGRLARAWSGLLAVTGADRLYWDWDFHALDEGVEDDSEDRGIFCNGPCAALTTPVLRADERGCDGATLRRHPVFDQRFAAPGKDAKAKAEREALHDALNWLAAHQSPSGEWDCDEFSTRCPAGEICEGRGQDLNDVGLTGLALLAFLSNGDTVQTGEFAPCVDRAVRWLLGEQDPDSGLIGAANHSKRIYSHSIATLALAEAYGGFEHPTLARALDSALEFVALMRDPYSAWGYERIGAPDTSITCWAATALWTGKQLGRRVDEEAFVGTGDWLQRMTDPATGRTGYNVTGSTSSRVPLVNDHFPADRNEGLTGVGVSLRTLLRFDGDQGQMRAKGLDLILRHLPSWDPDHGAIDFYSWFQESTALALAGDAKQQAAWFGPMRSTLVDSQRRDGHARGSWDARNDVWGFAFGRIGTTALGALILSAQARYDGAEFADKTDKKRRK